MEHAILVHKTTLSRIEQYKTTTGHGTDVFSEVMFVCVYCKLAFYMINVQFFYEKLNFVTLLSS